ncbi:SRPBCC family protein [Yinghuangia sp. ASG 101]|uniref:SRPBCC family protein n=1 Tax=Yinghuangia sp. ASG 101 TaxID=2896848 RepID=UPI001E2CA68C|nr:SRPBCC family protein [Yinghuangia sp. ASG 101]UGQ11743.1 SRPBCC family protein [Yinghuangia sp. ASG 101]
MATLHFRAPLRVPPETAWHFLECYSRAEVHAFSACVAERREGNVRVVTLADGGEVRERNVTVDAGLMRAVYTVPGLHGAEHHQAEMRIERHADGGAFLVWCTDVLPHRLAEHLREAYTTMFDELLDAVHRHRGPMT